MIFLFGCILRLSQTINLDNGYSLERRIRDEQKRKISLREEILRIRAEREQVALRMDEIRIKHEYEQQKAQVRISIRCGDSQQTRSCELPCSHVQ